MAAIEREPHRAASPLIETDGIPAGARRRVGSPRQAFAACAFGAVSLALVGAGDLPSWAERASHGPLAPLLREAASIWDEQVARLGLAMPQEALRRAVRWLIEYRWP